MVMPFRVSEWERARASEPYRRPASTPERRRTTGRAPARTRTPARRSRGRCRARRRKCRSSRSRTGSSPPASRGRAGSPAGSSKRTRAPAGTRARTCSARPAAAAPSSTSPRGWSGQARGRPRRRSPLRSRNVRRSGFRPAPPPRERNQPPLRQRRGSAPATRHTCRNCAFVLHLFRLPDGCRTTDRRSRMRPELLQSQTPRVERGRPELRLELLEGCEGVRSEHVFHHPDLAVVVEREVDVRLRDEVERQPPAARAADGEADRSVGRREKGERGREDGPRALLRVAEEAPGPFATSDPHGRQLAELAPGRLEPRRHQIEELPRPEPERRPVEIVVRDEPVVLLPASTVEPDAKDGGVRRAGELLDAAERRQQHVRLAPRGAGEGVTAGERVVHGDVVETTSDEKRRIVST